MSFTEKEYFVEQVCKALNEHEIQITQLFVKYSKQFVTLIREEGLSYGTLMNLSEELIDQLIKDGLSIITILYNGGSYYKTNMVGAAAI